MSFICFIISPQISFILFVPFLTSFYEYGPLWKSKPDEIFLLIVFTPCLLPAWERVTSFYDKWEKWLVKKTQENSVKMGTMCFIYSSLLIIYSVSIIHTFSFPFSPVASIHCQIMEKWHALALAEIPVIKIKSSSHTPNLRYHSPLLLITYL